MFDMMILFMLIHSYLTEACSHGFQCLYDNTAGATESMANFWRLIALTYKQSPNIIG
jgi:endoglycosylceramidase